jgi:hypothetical protein
MNKSSTALSFLAIAVGVGINCSYAQEDGPPPPPLTKVTGGGVIRDAYYVPSEDETAPPDFMFGEHFHLVSVRINPDQPPGRKSPQANILLAGPSVQAFWGGPLRLRADFEFGFALDFFGPDSKPGQMFRFVVDHPGHGEVAVWVFIHDNLTPGMNRENPSWSDWVMVWVEPVFGDGEPESGDDLFFVAGVVVSGNIMDHRKGYSY